MKPARILIADDEANIRLVLRKTLELDGYLIEEAANGRQALDAVTRQAPDLMLLDLNMPVQDGMSVLEELKNSGLGQMPRIIVLTAFGSVSVATRAMRLGAADFLEKPVIPGEVREAIHDVWATKAAPSPAHPEPHSPVEGYSGLLDRVRKALRKGDFPLVETLLISAEDLGRHDAAYFNLLGIYHEAQRQHRLARKFYGKAIAADGHYEPAQQNMRRLYELRTFGRTEQAVSLGDEADALYAVLPAGRIHK